MIAISLALLSVAGAAPAVPAPEAAPSVIARDRTRAAAKGRAPMPGFAASFAIAPAITGPAGWAVIPDNEAWAALSAPKAVDRQAGRWALARSLIGSNRGPEALGVLDTMLATDHDLALIDSFRLALGIARAETGDARGALAMLGTGTPGSGGLERNAEACAWRLWSFATLGEANAALGQIRCSLPALNARRIGARAPFLYAGARAALAAGRPAPVAAWLKQLPDSDAGANLYRGRAALALGDIAKARQRLAQVTNGNRQQQLDARVTLLEADLATGPATPAQIARIDQLAFTWRGGAIEQRVLRLSWRVGRERHDLRRSLAAGGALVRYFPRADDSPQMLAEVQKLLGAGLAPQSPMPIAEAAGLFWDNRDLAPVGAQGDFLASQLADRLQQAGLYMRAAELLRHQLLARTTDLAQGPLSARVAGLYILAGRPDQAIATLHETEAPSYPAEMLWERQRMAAVALTKLGRRAEALAAIQDNPDAGVIRGEIFWRARDWPALVAESTERLPTSPRLNGVEQAIVLRHAIALAMMAREPALAALRTRYLPAFAGQPGAATLDLLTREPASLDPEVLSTAMLAIPSVSPAGNIGDLLDVPVTPPPAKAAAAVSASNRPG